MRQEYIVETTPDGRLQLRLVLVPDEIPSDHLPEEEQGHVIIISPDDDDTPGVVVIEQ